MKNSTKIITVFSVILLLIGIVYVRNEYRSAKEEAYNKGKIQLLQSKDSLEFILMNALDEIDNRLDSIRDTQGYLVIGPGSNSDVVYSKKEQILNNIGMLRTVISDNSRKIQALEQKLRKADYNTTQLQNKLASYNQRNESILAEINSLKAQLAEKDEQLNAEIDKNSLLSEKIDRQAISYNDLKEKFEKVESDAYTAYYISGSKKQLKDLRILEKKKIPVINVAYSEKVTSYFPSGEFERVDTRDEAIIPVHTKKAELITPHPKESYVWRDDEEGMRNLCITNPEMFWQASRFLVIETK